MKLHITYLRHKALLCDWRTVFQIAEYGNNQQYSWVPLDGLIKSHFIVVNNGS